jgi:hypothetical protein
MLKVRFEFTKMVGYWNNEKGAGVKQDGTNDDKNWAIDVRGLDETVSINSKEEVEQALKDVLEKHYLPNDYLTIAPDGYLGVTTIEDGEGEIVYNEKRAKCQLYICDYSIHVEVQEVYNPDFDEAVKLFPSATY